MDLECIILIKVAQTQKDKSHIDSHSQFYLETHTPMYTNCVYNWTSPNIYKREEDGLRRVLRCGKYATEHKYTKVGGS